MKSIRSQTIFRRCYVREGTAGFTLIEIMIVVLIIGLLATIAIPNVRRAFDSARLRAIKSNLNSIHQVKTLWAAENRKGGEARPSSEELGPYFDRKSFPLPLADESYQIGQIDESPTAALGSKILDHPAGSAITLVDTK